MTNSDETIDKLRNQLKHLRERNEVLEKRIENLEKDKSQLKLYLDDIPQLISFVDKDLRYRFVNKAYADVFKFDRREVIGKSVKDFINKNIFQKAINYSQQALSGKEVNYFEEYEFIEGDKRYIQGHLIPSRNEENKIDGYYAILTDITNYIQSRKETETSEKRYKELVENINDIIFMLDSKGIITYISPVVTRYTGYLPEDMTGKPFSLFIHRGDLQRTIKSFENVKKGYTIPTEYRILCKNKSIIWAKSTTRVVNYDNDVKGFLGIAQDITKRKLSETALKQSEERFRNIATNTNDFIFEWDFLQNKMKWYGNIKKLIGNNPVPKTFDQWVNLAHPDDKKMLKAEIKQKRWKLEHRILTPSGKTKYLTINGVEVMDDDGSEKIYGAITDITKEKELIKNLEKARKEAEENNLKNKSILAAIPDIMFLFDKNGNIKDYHTEDSASLYLPPEEFLNKNVKDVLPKDLVELTMYNIDCVLKHKKIQRYTYKMKIDKKQKTFESRMVAVNNNLTLSIVRDITQTVKYEEELIKAKEKAVESDKLKSAFLANMSHEIRTPMNGIIGFAQMLNNKNISQERKDFFIQIINNSARQLLHIVEDIISISKLEAGLQEIYQKEFNLNDIILETHSIFLKEAEKKGLKFEYSIPENPPEMIIRSDQSKIRQIITNLVDNAIKYTIKGSVEFGYAITNDQPPLIEFFVVDSGIGIPASKQKIIFQRFVQGFDKTKQVFGGTGLGLSICQGLVKLLNGKITLESKEGKGSTFKIYIPHQKGND